MVDIVYTWADIGGSSFEVSFYFDRLSAVMVLIVTGVGSLIHVYSIGYMKDDTSYARYFSYLNLFLFFMLLLVLGRSLLVLFVGWEGVGLASYLLIGFWFEDPDKARAGQEGLHHQPDRRCRLPARHVRALPGARHAGHGPDQRRVLGAARRRAVSASLVGILLFIGAIGQIGADSAARLVAGRDGRPDAGVGVDPRRHDGDRRRVSGRAPVRHLSARARGERGDRRDRRATAFFAATIAVVQTDIKKVLAYSTISQLGFMFVALGVGAYGVAIFHLYTHAFFKACLFLGAGSVIHALGGEQDIRKMGGLARRIPITFVTFAVATAAIAGIPPLAGFFSKDEILWFAFASSRGGSPLLFVRGRDDRAADGLLHVPLAVAHVLRRARG